MNREHYCDYLEQPLWHFGSAAVIKHVNHELPLGLYLFSEPKYTADFLGSPEVAMTYESVTVGEKFKQ